MAGGDDTPSNGTASSYRGPSGIARESPWLTHEDLTDGKDVVVTIEDVLLRKDVTYEGGRKKPKVLALKFKGKERELAVNATNRRVLNDMFGTDTGGWVGKPIALFVQHGIRLGREERSGVRIRNKVIAAPAREPGSD